MDFIRFDFNLAAILILLVLPIIWGFWSLYHYRKERLEAFAEPAVLKGTVVERVSRIFSVQVCLYSIAWVFAVLSLMQPKGNERYVTNIPKKETSEPTQNLRQKHHLVIFLIDASASMSIEDNMAAGSRLNVAKEIVDDVISNLQGESVALFAFTSDTMQIVPFTMDYIFTRLMLQQLQINEGETSGTDIKGALESILKNRFVTTKDANKTLIIFTDGGDTSLYNLQESQLIDGINNIVKPLKESEKIHLKTLVVGTGSLHPSVVPKVTYQGKPVLSKLELPLLRKMSTFGQGQLWQTQETSSIEIANQITSIIQKDTSYVDTSGKNEALDSDEKNHIYDDYYRYFLSVALIALACSLLLPTTTRKLNSIKNKNISSALLLFCLFSEALWSQDQSEELRVPYTYYDAKDYGKAAKEYDNLYKEITSSSESLWQQAILLYDVGTALLADREYEKAIAKFEEASLLNISHPLLQKNLLINLSLAELLNVKLKSAKIKNDEKATFEQYSELFSLYRELLASIERASAASCLYIAAEGQAKCSPSLAIDEMKNEAKTLYANFLKCYMAFTLKNISIQEGIIELIAAVNSSEDHVNNLSSVANTQDPALEKKYLSFYKDLESSFLPLFDALEEAISKESNAPHIQEYNKNFKSARLSYQTSMKELDKNNVEESLKALKQTKLSLKQLLSLDLKEESYKDAIDRLLIEYKLLFIQDPLQVQSLGALRELQEILKKSFSLKGSANFYEKAEELLKTSQKALKEYKLITARLFFEGAYFYIYKIANLLADSEGRLTPAKILENSIKGEEISLQMTRLLQQSEIEKEHFDISRELLIDILSNTLQMSNSFVEKAISQQGVDFSTKAICQCKPWNEVIPLFFKGQDALSQVLDMLKSENFKIEMANQLTNYQESSLKYFKEALQKLNAKVTENQNQKQNKQKSDSKEQNSEQSSKEQDSNENADPQNQALNNVLKDIQAMESDDKSAPSIVIFKGKEGELSW